MPRTKGLVKKNVLYVTGIFQYHVIHDVWVCMLYVGAMATTLYLS